MIAEGVAECIACAGTRSGFRICRCGVGEAVGIRSWLLAEAGIGAEAVDSWGLTLLCSAASCLQAADGRTGEIDGAACDEGIGAAIKAVPGDGHGLGGRGVGEGESGTGGECEGGEEGEGAGHGGKGWSPCG